MSQRLILEERPRDGSATAPPVVGDAPANTDLTSTAPTDTDTDTDTDADTEATHVAVFPAPLHALGAAVVGGLAGLGAVYLVASRLAGTLAAVAAVVMIFAMTMAGPWVQARAETELGRVIAVALQALAFGGVLGALIILT